MKTFIASICAFSLLLFLITWNVCFVNRTMDEMENAVRALPACEHASEALDELDARWQEKRTTLSLSVSYNEMRDLDVYLAQMRAAAAERDDLQFETARLMALDAIKDIRRLERITLTSVL